MKHTLTIQLRGDRNYVQATSIFDGIVLLRQAIDMDINEIDFAMRRFTNKKCFLTLNSDNTFNDESIIGEYRDTCGKITILETTQPIIERIPYDESAIVNQCVIHENTINVPQDIPSYSFIEKAIAAYKNLLQKIFGKSGNFFFFIRLTLDYIPLGDLQIIYNRIISRKYYQGSIKSNQKIIGLIYFGVNKI